MARIRQYDEEVARTQLIGIFLEKGFADASLTDLESRSGLNRRQLYNDFGDKRSMFLQAVQDFMTLAGEQFLVNLEHSELGIQAIEKTLFGMVKLSDTRQGRLGCLVCNTAREPIAQDPEISKLINQYFRRIEYGYRCAIKRAIAMGEVSADENVRSLARLFLGVHISLCVMSRGGESAAVLTDVAKEAIKTLK